MSQYFIKRTERQEGISNSKSKYMHDSKQKKKQFGHSISALPRKQIFNPTNMRTYTQFENLPCLADQQNNVEDTMKENTDGVRPWLFGSTLSDHMRQTYIVATTNKCPLAAF